VQLHISADLAAARDLMRPGLALYIGGMGSRKQNFYNALVQRYGFEDAAREVQDLYFDARRPTPDARRPTPDARRPTGCGRGRPARRADRPSVAVRPPDVVRDRIAAFRDAGVGTLTVFPMAFEREDRLPSCATWPGWSADAGPPGCAAFLARVRRPGTCSDPRPGAQLATRDHEVTLETVSAEGD
jgi:hypothetical protein